MFERVRFIAEFAAAYRRSRRTGAAHDAALDAAAQTTVPRSSPSRTTLPERVAEIWLDPDEASGFPDGAWFGDGPFDITQGHLDLLRLMRFGWDSVERGAPMLDPRQPYGRADVLAQLGETFDASDDDEVARRHVEMFFVLARALRHATLPPGRYPLGNIGPADIRAAMAGYAASDTDLGLGPDGLVTITDDHLRLLRAIEIRWPSHWDCADRLAAGQYPAATADGKRPYGDYTFMEVDMARVLGKLTPNPADGIFEPDAELAARFARLHWQMLAAMQVFIEQANLTAGTYSLD